jgi:hypothetical protein
VNEPALHDAASPSLSGRCRKILAHSGHAVALARLLDRELPSIGPHLCSGPGAKSDGLLARTVCAERARHVVQGASRIPEIPEAVSTISAGVYIV